MQRGHEALKILCSYDFDTVLDIGCGGGLHTNQLRAAKKNVTPVDFSTNVEGATIGDYLNIPFETHDAIWCCHVLEHQHNTGIFLTKLISECKDGGIIAITVPPYRDRIVGGHVALWNTGLLMYRMILAGLDLTNAHVGTYQYNCSVVVRKKTITVPALCYDKGDIERIAQYFPIDAYQGFDGKSITHNWINS